jgi:hypothetical protein
MCLLRGYGWPDVPTLGPRLLLSLSVCVCVCVCVWPLLPLRGVPVSPARFAGSAETSLPKLLDWPLM